MNTTIIPLDPPSLDEIATVIAPALKHNFQHAQVSVVPCPDLREAPYLLANEGLCGDECVADVGGQPNLFPEPRLECIYSLVDIAREMQMDEARGHLLGAGAGPFHRIGVNCELAPNLSWRHGFENLTDLSYYTKCEGGGGKRETTCARSPTAECALMVNLYGSSGQPGRVLKVTARGRTGDAKSFPEHIRKTLAEHYGDARPISIGGMFLIKQGKARFHIMPDFPPKDQLPFKDAKQLDDWLTYHDFHAQPPQPIVCLTVFHSADPEKKLGLRIEHTHCFSTNGTTGGHYHYDLLEHDGDEVEYEGYFNTAQTLYRIDQPVVTLKRDQHD